jgi:DNA-binding CsgD family transcriptional regulator
MKDLLDSSTPRPATHRPDFRPPAPMTITAPDIHQGWLTAGKRPAGGDGPLATRGDDAAFALALSSLTRRQRQIVRLRARGLTIAEIGDRYYLSENTVKNHLRGAFRALGLDGLRHQARLGRACYLLGRYDGSRESRVGSRKS